MPGAIIGVVAAVVGAVVAAAPVIVGTLGVIGAAVAGAVVTVAISYAGSALLGSATKKQEEPPPLASTEAQPLSARKRTIRESASPRRVIIGRCKVGGVIIFVHAKSADGVNDKYLLLAVAMAGHTCASLETVWLDDAPITDPKFAGLVAWFFSPGLPDQSPPQWFIEDSEGRWTAEHRCRGIAVLYLRLTKDETAFPRGMPDIAATIRGLTEAIDPATGATSYTANAARIINWYLTSPLGLADAADAVDQDTLLAAVNICDEEVPLRGGGSEKRYRCHGTFTLDEEPGKVLRKLLSSCAGDAIYAGGKWYIEPAAWRASNRVIAADEVRGEVSVSRNRAFRDLANGVRATYVREAAGWEETDAPPLLDVTARAQDGGEAVYDDLALPFTLSGTCAQRIMQIRLRRLRAQRSYRIPTMLHHVALRPGSVVTVDLPRQQRQTIRLDGWTLDADGRGVTLSGHQDGPEIYSWTAATDERALPAVGLITAPSGTGVLTPAITITPATAPVPSSYSVSWSAVSGAAHYELGWRGSGGGAFTTTSEAGTSATPSTAGLAEFRVRAAKDGGEYSAYDTASFPPPVPWFVVRGATGGIYCEFAGTGRIQVFAASTGTLFAGSTLVATLTANGAVSLAAGTWDVWARALSDKGVVGPETGVSTVTAADEISGGVVEQSPAIPPQGYLPPPDAPGGEGSGGGGGSEGGGSGGDSDGGGGEGGGESGGET